MDRWLVDLIDSGTVEELEVQLASDETLAREWVTPEGDRLVHFAAWYDRADMLTALLRRGADPSARGYRDWTPLHYAAFHAAPATTSLLIRAGAGVNALDSEGRTPLFRAINNQARGGVEAATVVGLLLCEGDARFDVPSAISLGQTELVAAVFSASSPAPAALCDYLTLAVAGGRSDIVRLLIGRGAHRCCRELGIDLGWQAEQSADLARALAEDGPVSG